MNESGESKYKEGSRLNNATSPREESTILHVKDSVGKVVPSKESSEKRDVSSSRGATIT